MSVGDKMPIVNRENYTMYIEYRDGFYWFHTDVYNWTFQIKNSFIDDLNCLQSLLRTTLYAFANENNFKLIKFGKLIGFKYKQHMIGKDQQLYVVYIRE